MQGLPEVGDLSTDFEWTFDEARSQKIADALKKDSDRMAARFEHAAKEQNDKAKEQNPKKLTMRQLAQEKQEEVEAKQAADKLKTSKQQMNKKGNKADDIIKA